MNFRKTFAFVSILAMTLVPVAALADGSEVSIKGEVLDLACYVSHESHGEEHAGCAVKCVKEGGQPMGLLADDGTIYVLFADHSDSSAFEEAKDFAGQTVEISGPMADKGGVKGITVQGVKEL